MGMESFATSCNALPSSQCIRWLICLLFCIFSFISETAKGYQSINGPGGVHIQSSHLNTANPSGSSGSTAATGSRRRSLYHNFFLPIHRNEHISATALAMGAFNPFTLRNRNSNVKWYESDLEGFFEHIENQSLLNAEQEMLYGKALKLWTQVQTVRERLYEEKVLKMGTEEVGLEEAEADTTEPQEDYSETFEFAEAADLEMMGNSSSYFNMSSFMVSYQEVAGALGCSVKTLRKLEKYAEAAHLALINGNLKLVLAVVSRYRTSGIPNVELIAEGVKGLGRAAMRYDYSRGFRFSTYATWYIHQCVADFVRWKKHPMKMPSKYLTLLRKVRQFSSEFERINGRQPSTEEIATNLQQPMRDISKVMAMNVYPTVLNTPLHNSKGEDMDRTVGDTVLSNSLDPSANTVGNLGRYDFEQIMVNNLEGSEREVMRLRLGLEKGYVVPVKEISQMLDISWKQVRNIEKQALNKLLGQSTSSSSKGYEPVMAEDLESIGV